MRITQGKTVLRSLDKEDLELVRNWRNNESVNQHLLHREYISKEAQLKWFAKTETDNALYLIIEENAQPLGLIYATEIDIQKNSFYGNIMMGYPLQKDAWTSVKAVLLLCDLMLLRCNFKIIYSVVHKNNSPALAMNRRLGFIPFKEDEDVSYQRCEIEHHYSKTERIRSVLLGSDKTAITLDRNDKNLVFLSRFRK